MTSVEDILEHHGIKGMKWGVRRKNPSASSGPEDVSVGVHRLTGRIVTKGGKGQAPHEDAIAAAKAKQKAKSSGPQSLSNKEMKVLVDRMNLEQQYSRLTTKPDNAVTGKLEKGNAQVKVLLGLGKTAQEVVSLANGPLGKELSKALKAK